MSRAIRSRIRSSEFSGGMFDALVATVVINLLALAMPLALLQIYDRVIPNQAYGTTTVLIVGVGLAVVLEVFLRYGRSHLLGAAGARYEHQAGCAAFGHLLAADLAAFEQVGSGPFVERFNALQIVKDFYTGQAILTLFDMPFAALYVVLIWYIGGDIVYVPISVIAIYLLLALFSGRMLDTAVRADLDVEERRIGFLIRLLSGLQSIKSMGLEKGLTRRFEALQHEKSYLAASVDRVSTGLTDHGNTLAQICTVGVITAGAFAVMDGELTSGGLAACTLLAGRALAPLSNAAGSWARFQSIRVARDRVNSIFALPRNDVANDTGQHLDLSGAISLRRLVFRSSAKHQTILGGIDLDVPAGSAISITGPNGAGKSLLLTLMAGLATPSSGTVKLDGVPVSEIDLDSLRSQVVLLPQREVLFRGTVMENLTVFRPELEARALVVAAALGIGDQISRLPRGYRTQAGEGASQMLSRSLIQQIAIARALVVPPKILLFDDANSAIDGEGDQFVKDVLWHLKGRCTLVIVSHRPSILRIAERVYQLSEGGLEAEFVSTETL
ncbi:MAG: ATP-binding cassette domain-containing protein [Thalassobaculaceae bacterium]|nr:ATP-binding cassette domain-containing protein [Thalassobaculaceae bacterium]